MINFREPHGHDFYRSAFVRWPSTNYYKFARGRRFSFVRTRNSGSVPNTFSLSIINNRCCEFGPISRENPRKKKSNRARKLVLRNRYVRVSCFFFFFLSPEIRKTVLTSFPNSNGSRRKVYAVLLLLENKASAVCVRFDATAVDVDEPIALLYDVKR